MDSKMSRGPIGTTRSDGAGLGSYPSLTPVRQPGGNTVPPSQGNGMTRSPGVGTGVHMDK